MAPELDPQTPEESDGGVTSASAAGRGLIDAIGARGQRRSPKSGDLSDLSRHDQ
ncbi:hypothetical protein [Nocardia sp. alder85J]|uniref:hypothetical protein n=1 Tax=Nocardia sp. alder85J TaxID=2862949 RepID=UPI001CD47CF2|nr:hypothetical protein [Nocardia sp. alder85J]MCX4098937.1 hypothetical protein [Nocardia sp. alder85J]